ncbi:MAG: hypothetical protein RLO50_10520 [Azospirillaceae bacterium]
MSTGRMFDRYVTVDWSAAATPRTGADSIWIAALTPGASPGTINPGTRAEAIDIVADLMADDRRTGRRTLFGFDFPFGYPVGTVAALRVLPGNWRGVWKLLRTLIVDRADNWNNRFAVAGELNRRIGAGEGPFWGCPRAQVTRHLSGTRPDYANIPLPERRMVDNPQRFRTAGLPGAPQPVWKLFTAGSVGGQALTGIATLARLLRERPDLAQGTRIWPLDTGMQAPYAAASVWVELYPTMFADRPATGQVKDEAQVVGAARWLGEADSAGRLPALFRRPSGVSDAQAAAIVREEGWIFGLP